VAPYERWQYYNENVKSLEQAQDYSVNKTKGVAWFVSNCGARNGRLNYAKELGKFIQVRHWKYHLFFDIISYHLPKK
jgi:glycoprotein 3-alpha-L-fucosyltransferase